MGTFSYDIPPIKTFEALKLSKATWCSSCRVLKSFKRGWNSVTTYIVDNSAFLGFVM